MPGYRPAFLPITVLPLPAHFQPSSPYRAHRKGDSFKSATQWRLKEAVAFRMAAIRHHNKGPRPGDFIGPTRRTLPPDFRGYCPQIPARPRCLSSPESESARSAGARPAQLQAARPAAAGSPGAAPSRSCPPCRSGPRERAGIETQVTTRRRSPRRVVGQGGHSPAQISGGRGGWQPGAFRTPLSLLLLLATAGLLPSVWIPQTTSLLATRPGSAGSRGRRNRLQRLEPPVTPPSEHARVELAAGVGGGR